MIGLGILLIGYVMDKFVLFRIESVWLMVIKVGFWLFRDCIGIWEILIWGVLGILILEKKSIN